FLGENYADALAGGRLQLAYEEAAARLAIAYYDHRFPIALADYPALLRTGNTDTATHAVADRFAGLGTIRSVRTRRERADEARYALRNLATTAAGAAHIAEAVRTLNAQHDELDALMARQHWRLAHWR
ncbi:hypothetical protein, partial [Salmonella enterica]|uniref:hypothetical protein n=1 Tax=Salmonella enterica TaxID=28901 RepID=UPI00398C3540